MSEVENNIYKYRAVNKKGRIVNGSLSAKNEVHLHHLLDELGLSLINSKKVQRSNVKLFGWAFSKRIRLRDKIQLYFQLRQLQQADIGITDALEYAAHSLTSQALLDIVHDIKKMISDGMSLSESMAKYPECFTKLEVAIIKVCEHTGNMLSGYKYLVSYLQEAEKMQERVKKATRYPMILVGVIFLAVTILMGHVVPQIIGFIRVSTTLELPFYTIALINVSDFFQAYWLYVIIFMVVVVFSVITMRKISDVFRYRTDALILHIPLIGVLVRKTEIARFMHVLGTLYTAGIPIVSSLKESSKIVKNEVLKAATQEIWEDVSNGETIANAVQNTGEFDALVIQLIDVAEKSSGLHNALSQITDIYNNDVDQALQAAIDYLEPMLTAIMALLIFWIILAVFGPIYSMFEEIDF